MATELYMLGLIVHDMDASLEFYRRLGLAVPENSAGKSHVEIKMGTGLTFFLDSNPARWDPEYPAQGASGSDAKEARDSSYQAIMEFYLETQDSVDAKYKELTELGYTSHRAPYVTSFGMYFAMVKDPDGHVVLLSGQPG